MRRFAAAFVLGVAVVPVAVGLLGFLGLLCVAATSQPGTLESAFASRVVPASLQRASAGLQGPAASEPLLLVGMRLYRNNCAGCHGDSQGPSLWGATSFYPRAPQFAQDGSRLSTAQMYVAVKYGIRYSGMGAWKNLMSDDDIWRVVTFLGQLQHLPPTVDSVWKSKQQARAGGA